MLFGGTNKYGKVRHVITFSLFIIRLKNLHKLKYINLSPIETSTAVTGTYNLERLIDN